MYSSDLRAQVWNWLTGIDDNNEPGQVLSNLEMPRMWSRVSSTSGSSRQGKGCGSAHSVTFSPHACSLGPRLLLVMVLVLLGQTAQHGSACGCSLLGFGLFQMWESYYGVCCYYPISPFPHPLLPVFLLCVFKFSITVEAGTFWNKTFDSICCSESE